MLDTVFSKRFTRLSSKISQPSDEHLENQLHFLLLFTAAAARRHHHPSVCPRVEIRRRLSWQTAYGHQEKRRREREGRGAWIYDVCNLCEVLAPPLLPNLKGTTKRLRPSLVNKRWKNYILLPAAGSKTQFLLLLFTKPGRSLLVVPCTCIFWLYVSTFWKDHLDIPCSWPHPMEGRNISCNAALHNGEHMRQERLKRLLLRFDASCSRLASNHYWTVWHHLGFLMMDQNTWSSSFKLNTTNSITSQGDILLWAHILIRVGVTL